VLPLREDFFPLSAVRAAWKAPQVPRLMTGSPEQQASTTPFTLQEEFTLLENDPKR
jgi:hypothetical protein